MAEPSLTDPQQVASIQQGRDAARAQLIDIAGGVGWVVVIGFLFALVLLVDTFGLPTLMSLRNEPRAFFDFCGDPTAAAGGFAVALVGLIAVALVGLSVIAKRSVVPSWAFLLVLLGAQWGIASFGGVTPLIENLSDREWLPLLTGTSFSCSDGNTYGLRDRLQGRYNPSIVASLAGGDVSRAFTSTLAINILVLGVFTAVVGALAMLAPLVRMGRAALGRAKDVDPDQDVYAIKGWYALRGAERTITVQGALLTLLAATVGPIIVLYVTNPTPVTQAVENLLWVGPLMFIMDLARLAIWVPEAKADTSLVVDTQDEQEPLILPQVMKAFRRGFPGKLQTEVLLAADTTTASVDQAKGGAAGQRRGVGLIAPDRYPMAGQSHLYLDTLTSDHYEMFTSILDQQILDQGKTALIICPLEALDDVEAAFSALLAREPGNLLPNWHKVGDAVRTNQGRMNIVLAAPETLETLIHNIADFDQEIRQLGGLLILNLNRIDLGHLHASLKRLKAYVARSSELVNVIQSEFRNEIRDWINNMPLLQGSDIIEVPPRRQNRAISQHLAVSQPIIDADLKEQGDWPLDYKAMLLAEADQPLAEPYLLDLGAQHSVGVWSRWVLRALDSDTNRAPYEWAQTLEHPVLAPIDAKRPVAVINDLSNLADTFNVGVGTGVSIEAMRFVILGNYPVAPFLQREFDTRISKATTDREKRDVLRRFSDDFSSLAAQPEGGPSELAMMIRQEFESVASARQRVQAGGGEADALSLSQERVAKIWDPTIGALKQLQIRNTPRGLDRLLRIAFRVSDKQPIVTKTETEKRFWNYTLSSNVLLSAEAIPSLRLKTSTGDVRPEVLPLADHGLSYAEGTRIAIAGKIYLISTVNPGQREIYLTTDDDKPMHPYRFARSYALIGEAGQKVLFAADRLRPAQTTQTPFEIAVGYFNIARKTTSFDEFGGLHTPFAQGETKLARFTPVNIDDPTRLRGAAVLRLYGTKIAGGRRRALGAVAAGVKRSRGGGQSNDKLAFTLVTTLQDVLRTQFPTAASRIAVVSPAAGYSVQPGTEASPQMGFALRRQPWLQCLAPNGEIVAQSSSELPTPLRQQMRVKYHELVNDIFDTARSVSGAAPLSLSPLLSIFVIEDSDHDLGVAKAFDHEHLRIFRIWRDFLGFCKTATPDEIALSYGFGTKEVPDCFDFEAAFDLVDAMLKRRD